MEPVLPNRLRYPVVREDIWTIDHISCMLSDASRRLLEDILGSHVGYINPNGSYRPMCVTVAYSRSLIELYWFTRQHDLDDFMEFDTRKRPIVVPLDEVTADNVTDKHGIQHGSLIKRGCSTSATKVLLGMRVTIFLIWLSRKKKPLLKMSYPISVMV